MKTKEKTIFSRLAHFGGAGSVVIVLMLLSFYGGMCVEIWLESEPRENQFGQVSPEPVIPDQGSPSVVALGSDSSDDVRKGELAVPVIEEGDEKWQEDCEYRAFDGKPSGLTYETAMTQYEINVVAYENQLETKRGLAKALSDAKRVYRYTNEEAWDLFVRSQIAWKEYRELSCKAIVKGQVDGGSASGMVYSSMYGVLTRERQKIIESFFLEDVLSGEKLLQEK